MTAAKRDEGEAVALEALKRSVIAIDDWLNVYASELCNEQRVAEAHQRIGDAGGTLAYIAYVQAENRAAIAAIDDSDGEIITPAPGQSEAIRAEKAP